MKLKKYHQLVREAAINFVEIDYYNDLEVNVEFNFWFQIISNDYKIVIEDNWFSGRIILINLETGNRTRIIDREPLKIIKKRIKNNNKLFK